MRILMLPLMLFMLAGCTAGGSLKFQEGLIAFQSNVAAVNQTIAEVSPQLAQYCDDAVAAGKDLDAAAFVDKNSKAGRALSAVNVGIVTWCQRVPTNISTAIRSMVDVVRAARSAASATRTGG